MAASDGHEDCQICAMQQIDTPQFDSPASNALQQQWRYAVAHLADMVRLHEALQVLPLAGSSSSRRAALAELESCIAEAHRELQEVSQSMGREMPGELSPKGSDASPQPHTLTPEEEAEFACALDALGYESSKFAAQPMSDGRLLVAAPNSRVFYDRKGWLAKFAAHLMQGLFGPP
jgi:hypothetical protein